MKKSIISLILYSGLIFLFSLEAHSKGEPLPDYSKAGFWEVKNSGREVLNFNVGWRFMKGEVEGAQQTDFDDSDWAKVNCPHGLEYNSSEASGSVNYQGPAWYRKHFTLDGDLSARVLKLYFESVMGKCKVWLNGSLIGEHYGGYLPFMVNLEKFLVKDGDNVLAVWADNSDDPSYPPGKPQTRLDFSYFGGIYRDVWLVASNKIYVSNPNEVDRVAGGGMFAQIVQVSEEEALVRTMVDVQNDDSKTHKLVARLRILDPQGKEVARSTQNITIKAGKAAQFESSLSVKQPKLWTPWSPELYRFEVVLSNASGQPLDGVAVKTGLRTIDFRGPDGFFLNNEPYPGKLIGANRHQDHGYVGNALPNNGQWRDAVILKSAGFDIIRAAHYPADPAFMDACDALGLFYIEATPGWQFWNDDDPLFEQRVYSDIRQMVRRDRNYASVIMWEPILNETSYPDHFAKRTHDIVHEEYPFPGAFTVCDGRAGGQEHFDVLYAHDYNASYGEESRCFFTREFGDNVDDFNAQNSPSRVARGWGERPQLVQAIGYANGDYDKYTTLESLHQQPPQFVGGTLWCGFDHQRGYAVDPFYGGICDVFRQPKYSYHMFASQADVSESTEPMIFIANELTPFSEPDVTVFTNCDEVRLTLHDGYQVLQKKANVPLSVRVLTPHGQPNRTETRGRMSMPHPVVTFEDIYHFKDMKSMHRGGKKYDAGLLAEGLIDGEVVTSFWRASGKKPTRLQLSLESRNVPLMANGSDFVVVVASIVDEKGVVKRLNDNVLKFEVSGEGAIVGDESINANPKQISWGTAPVLVRSSTKSGKIKVRASLIDEGVNTPQSGELVFESVVSPDRFIYSELGTESNTSWYSSIEASSEEELRAENKRLKKELVKMQLKEEEKKQLEFDEHR